MTSAEPRTADDPVALWASARVTELLDGHGADEVTPEYGSTAWQQLRANDPHRAAAIIEAAESWRHQRAREQWLDQLLDEDPEQWFRIVTAEADAHARRVLPALARRPTVAEVRERAVRRTEPRAVRASPSWPPVAIPGRPGWWRHCGPKGEQMDLPHNERSGAAAA